MIARYLFNKNNNDRYSKIYSEKGFELMHKTKIITGKMNWMIKKKKITENMIILLIYLKNNQNLLI
jgi:hypothetical protein